MTDLSTNEDLLQILLFQPLFIKPGDEDDKHKREHYNLDLIFYHCAVVGLSTQGYN